VYPTVPPRSRKQCAGDCWNNRRAKPAQLDTAGSEGGVRGRQECGATGPGDGPHPDIPIMKREVLLVKPHGICFGGSARTSHAQNLATSCQCQVYFPAEVVQGLRLRTVDLVDGVGPSGLDR